MDDFETWAAARSASLARSAYLLTADRHLAEDLLQETLVRVAERWPRLRRGGVPDAWARRTMHHLAIDRWRRLRIRPVEVAVEGIERPGVDETQRAVDRMALQQALERLTVRQRAMVSLRYYEDLTEVQTAELLGCSVSTVKSESRRALQRLRELAPEIVKTFQEATT